VNELSLFEIGVSGGVILIIIGFMKFIYKTYNELIEKNLKVDKQTSHVEAHLKKKFDLIPDLINIVKGYTKHEKGLYIEVTKLRSQWSKANTQFEKMKTSNMLESALSKLMLVNESYPKIKADKNFRDIQFKIAGVERELLHERKVYNKRVYSYNVTLKTFPKLIIAKLFNFKEKQFFSYEIKELGKDL
jgi:LemA protein